MKRVILFFFFVCLGPINIVPQIFAQDSVRVIIITSKLGPVIDSTERESYKFFSRIGNDFVSAFFFMTADSQSYCLMTLRHNETKYDSLIQYQFISLYTMAMRAIYYETNQLVKPDEVVFSYLDTVITHIPDMIIKKTEGPVPKLQIPDVRTTKTDEVGMLPLAENNINAAALIKDEWQWYIGAGIVYRSSGLKGLDKLYNIFEEALPQEGYSLPYTSSDFIPGPLASFSSTIIFRDLITAELMYEFLNFNKTELKIYQSLGFSLGYRYKLSENFFPYISAGYSKIDFKARKNYSRVISPDGYPLDYIQFNGRMSGLEFKIGFFYKLSDVVSLNVSGGYKFLSQPELSSDGQYKTIPGEEYKPLPDYRVNADGFETGISLMFK